MKGWGKADGWGANQIERIWRSVRPVRACVAMRFYAPNYNSSLVKLVIKALINFRIVSKRCHYRALKYLTTVSRLKSPDARPEMELG